MLQLTLRKGLHDDVSGSSDDGLGVFAVPVYSGKLAEGTHDTVLMTTIQMAV